MSFPGLIDFLCCPETHQKLHEAPADLLDRLRIMQAAGNLRTRSGSLVTAPIDEGLVREDGNVLYLICDGIPVLLIDEAVILTKTA